MKRRVGGSHAVVVPDNEGLHELVCLAGCVATLDSLLRRLRPGALRLDDRAKTPLHPLPAIVSVHPPISARHRTDSTRAVREGAFDVGDVPRGGSRLNVSPVEKCVDHDGNAGLFCQVDEGAQVHERRVHTSIAHQAKQVQPTTALFGFADDGLNNVVRPDGAVVNRVVDLGDIHHRNATRTQVEVPYLAIAHLAWWQADVRPARTDETVRVAFLKRREHGGSREAYGVVRALRSFAETIENHQN